jgi:parvulin-like peptidyl-prolyl isomerase
MLGNVLSPLSSPRLTWADEGNTTVVDLVAASVDGKPITLHDVSARLGLSTPLSASEFASNARAQETLQLLINERLIEEQASSRNISVSDAEVDRYIGEVASRNGMSRSDFESSLSIRQIPLAQYRAQVRTEIMRSRLIGQLSEEGAAVTDADVERFVRENPTLSKSGSKVRLRQIVIARRNRGESEVESRSREILEALDSGRSFEDVAQEYSDGPEASDGGLLGVVAEEDLAPPVFEALLTIDKGSVSPAVALPDSVRIFKVEERFKDEGEGLDEQLLAEIRRSLSEKKLQEKMYSFFTSEILKLHHVDRKL